MGKRAAFDTGPTNLMLAKHRGIYSLISNWWPEEGAARDTLPTDVIPVRHQEANTYLLASS